MRRLGLGLFLLLWAPLAWAQDLATLVADSITISSDTTLIATGHVEVFFQGQRLTAQAIEYNRTGDRLRITGPLRIEDGKGSVFLAEQADLSAAMTEGVLTSARLVLNAQLQLSAGQIQRLAGGAQTAMRSVAASSCTICEGNATPLWEIRAREVVHDGLAQQIYFSDASLRFYGVPVLFLPILRVPDPTLKRATGFLLPRIRSTTELGTGLKLPYFITLGRTADITLTPYLSTLGGRTLELRYRQAFGGGMLEIDAAGSRDRVRSGTQRGYLQATGSFNLGNDFLLAFKGISISDPGYLTDYGISETDRLENVVSLTRVQRDLSFSARLIGFQSIREGESNSTLPSTVSDIAHEKRFSPAIIGGTAAFRLGSHSDYRNSTVGIDTTGDGTSEGRDLGRISVGFDWTRNWISQNGFVLTAMGTAAADFYSIVQDDVFEGSPTRVSGAAGVELRWPLVKNGAAGRSEVLEPVLQLISSTNPDTSVPNGDSTLVEFDEGNLFSLDRYPGADAVEAGKRANLGLIYTRMDPQGWSLGITAGRVFRLDDQGQFSAASGLDGKTSDWLLSWSVKNVEGIAVTNRLVVDDTLSLTKGELRFDYARANTTLSGGYEYLLADASEDRATTASELRLDARQNLTDNWSAVISSRYDLRADRMARSGLELDFRNECLDMTLSLSRRFASSTSVSPSTDFGLSVELLGFGGGSAAGPSRTCRR